jgi:hypothetical protein
MNIGDVNNVNIPSITPVECQNGCETNAIKYRNGVPLCRECWLAEQQKPWEDEANQFVAWDGTVYEVVRRV